MSLATINLKQFAAPIRSVIAALKSGRVGTEAVSIAIPATIEPKIVTTAECITITFTPMLEASIKHAPDPDIIRIRTFDTYSIVDFRISNIRIEH